MVIRAPLVVAAILTSPPPVDSVHRAKKSGSLVSFRFACVVVSAYGRGRRTSTTSPAENATKMPENSARCVGLWQGTPNLDYLARRKRMGVPT
jgi:hypothetical protein